MFTGSLIDGIRVLESAINASVFSTTYLDLLSFGPTVNAWNNDGTLMIGVWAALLSEDKTLRIYTTLFKPRLHPCI